MMPALFTSTTHASTKKSNSSRRVMPFRWGTTFIRLSSRRPCWGESSVCRRDHADILPHCGRGPQDASSGLASREDGKRHPADERDEGRCGEVCTREQGGQGQLRPDRKSV